MGQDYKVSCRACDAKVEHVCNSDLTEAAVGLYGFRTECRPGKHFNPSGYYEVGDERAPCFSEAYLYNLLGKEDARTVLAHIGNLLRAAGLDAHDLRARAHARLVAEERDKEERQKRRDEIARHKAAMEKPVSERKEGKCTIYTYRSYEALDVAIRKHEVKATDKIDVVLTPEVLRFTVSGKKAHEVARQEVVKYVRFYLRADGPSAAEFLAQNRNMSPRVHAVLRPLVEEVARTRDMEMIPVSDQKKGPRGIRRVILASPQALDEYLSSALWRVSDEMRKKSPGHTPYRSITDLYGVPYLEGDLVLMSIGDVEEYGIDQQALRDFSRSQNPGGRLHSSVFSRMWRMACQASNFDVGDTEDGSDRNR